MKSFIKIFFVILLGLPFQVISQSSLLWENLHCPNNYDPISLYFDTTQNSLFMISSLSDSSRVSKWDGTNWTSFPSTGCSSGLSITNYGGELLIAGGGCYPILKWNGTNWQPFQSILPNGNVNCFLQDATDLYIGGSFDSIGSNQTRAIAKWNGSTWNSIGSFPFYPFSSYTNVHSLTFYMGDLIAGGLITDNSGNVINIVKWDGVSWSPLGGGIHGGMDDVFDMITYNNELYVAGAFTTGDGNAGNYIQKWNGFNWSDVGGGVVGDFGGNGQIFDLEVYNSSLYAVGYFSFAGGVPALQIAKWDGNNWCSLGNEIAHAVCLTKSLTDLYVGGGFKLINGDSTGSITKWIGGNYTDTCGTLSGVDELIENINLIIYPNPSTNQLTIEFNLHENVVIELKNILGQTIKRIDNLSSTGSKIIEIDISQFSKGLYFLQVTCADQIISRKFVKG